MNKTNVFARQIFIFAYRIYLDVVEKIFTHRYLDIDKILYSNVAL